MKAKKNELKITELTDKEQKEVNALLKQIKGCPIAEREYELIKNQRREAKVALTSIVRALHLALGSWNPTADSKRGAICIVDGERIGRIEEIRYCPKKKTGGVAIFVTTLPNISKVVDRELRKNTPRTKRCDK